MIGLLVQLTAEFAKIWSTSSLRLITYSRDDLPYSCHEGDWINIELDDNGVMRNVTKAEDLLETKRDARGKLQVLDVFIVDSRIQKAFCETFGLVRIENSEGGGRWTDERRTKDHCIILWMTISSNAQFSIEEQSLERANSKDGKYAGTYNRLMEQVKKYQEPMEKQHNGEKEFDEMILIVGHDVKTNVYFSFSRCGEGFVNSSVWMALPAEKNIEKGAVFRARLNKQSNNPMHKVVHLYARVELWEGVLIDKNNMSVELDAEVVERRQTCFALDTEPFGLVTYPFESFLSTDIHVGDHLRVVLMRYKVVKDEFPSKWKVVRIVKMLKKAGKKEENMDWFEGVVTSVYHTNNALITFKLGTALLNMNADNMLTLGDIVDIRVVPNSRKDGFFDVVDMGEETRRRDDLVVEPFEQTKCNVFCVAEVIDYRDDYYILKTPIIGCVIFFFKEAPRKMRVGDVWSIKMLRRKNKKNYPSFWVATSIAEDFPRALSASNRRREERDMVEYTSGYSSKSSFPSTSNTSRDNEWTTVIITGSDVNGFWYGSCALADPIKITTMVNKSGKDLEKGSFYRIKVSIDSEGHKIVYQLDPQQVYPEDVKLFTEKRSLAMWCYSRIVEKHESSFTVHNELVGDATLPFKRAMKGMKVGDNLATLYYRVKKTDNPTHWMVQEARIDRRNIHKRDDYNHTESYREEERDYDERRRTSIEEKRRPDYHHVNEEGVNETPAKDSRVIGITRRFMMNPEIREKFMKECPETLEKIERILKKTSH